MARQWVELRIPGFSKLLECYLWVLKGNNKNEHSIFSSQFQIFLSFSSCFQNLISGNSQRPSPLRSNIRDPCFNLWNLGMLPHLEKLCRYDSVKGLRIVRLSLIIHVGPNFYTCILYKWDAERDFTCAWAYTGIDNVKTKQKTIWKYWPWKL